MDSDHDHKSHTVSAALELVSDPHPLCSNKTRHITLPVLTEFTPGTDIQPLLCDDPHCMSVHIANFNTAPRGVGRLISYTPV